MAFKGTAVGNIPSAFRHLAKVTVPIHFLPKGKPAGYLELEYRDDQEEDGQRAIILPGVHPARAIALTTPHPIAQRIERPIHHKEQDQRHRVKKDVGLLHCIGKRHIRPFIHNHRGNKDQEHQDIEYDIQCPFSATDRFSGVFHTRAS